MQRTWLLTAVVTLLVLYLGSSSASRDCNCRPPLQCPQAFRSGRPRQCRLSRYRPGVCCPRSGGGGSSPLRNCRPLVLCPAALSDPANFGGSACLFEDGSTGVMCSDSGQDAMQVALGNRNGFGSGAGSSGAQPLSPARTLAESLLVVNRGDMRSAAAAASRSVDAQIALNNRLLSGGLTPAADSTVGIFNLNFRSNQAVQNLGLDALRGLQTLTNINAQGSSSADEMVSVVSRFGDSSGGGVGPSQPTRVDGCENEDAIFCTPGQYRTVNGECNNLQRPRQGRALTGFRRLLESTYDDGIFSIRSQSVNGGQLPSPRLVSERVVETFSQELRGFTLSVMQWGQFIDHDFNHALVFRAGTEAIECCENNGATLPASPLHPACIPIPIPQDDPFYSNFAQRCMTLVRSLPAPDPDCIARPATPLNELTSYLDASMVYGSQENQLDGLRTFSGGLLITTGRGMLPLQSTPRQQRRPGAIFFNGPTSGGQSEPEPEGESCRDAARVCFRGGESRVNEQSALTVMHTIFTREHNRIASALSRHGRRWNDEKLFQEARRIVIAEWQHIVYNEWLPIVVGFDFARDHALRPLQTGFSNTYDTTVDASASNEFATAAFRFGHSLLRDMYDLVNSQGQTVGSVNVTRTFFDPSVVAASFVEHARTLVARRSETFDSNVIRSVHEQLFTSNFLFGLDLIALNIQRGRDHGIPTYVSMLQACKGVTVNRWSDLNNLMDSSNIDRLRGVYANPRDVDLFIGGLSERRAPGAQVGPTFQCIIGEQFFDLRFGDRFFYDLGGQSHSFTEGQLSEIRKTSWARMMCDTLGPEFGGDFHQVQPLAFVESGVGPNALSRCNSRAIPTMDLSVF